MTELDGDPETAARAFRALFEHAPVALGALTTDGRLFAANPALRRLLGVREPRELVVDELAPPEEIARLNSLLARVVAGDPVTELGPLLTRGGRVMVRCTLMAVRTPAGEPSYLLAVVEPTDDSRAHLHDLANILMPLVHLAERLFGSLAGSGPTKVNAGQVRDLARKAFEIAREGAQGDAAREGPVDVNRVIAGLRPLTRLLLGPRIDVVVKPDRRRPLARVGRLRLERALENVAVNARDAMPNGGTFTVETQQRDETVAIRCSDTGTGIPPDELERIFDPDFTTKGAGHGLGLASVRDFAVASGGTVTVESEPGAGTTVTLILPRAVATA